MVEGFKHTEVGVIPSDWNAVELRNLIKIKGGFAFSSQFFSNNGPILLTPGNFKLEGGLYFENRNTKRYSGEYHSSMLFKFGDLLIVMTDLTPDCNLLGKPAFVDIHEDILHNQRIGKVELLSKDLSKEYFYWIFLSSNYSRRIKDTATGSTVRHTSNSSIFKTYIPVPPTKAEQTAIATVLNDTDVLINQLELLLTKKRNIKTGAMQELLKPKEGWEGKTLGEIADVFGGGTPSTSISKFWNGDINWFTPTEIGDSKYSYESLRKITNEGLKNSSARMLPIGTILLTSRASIGDASILMKESCTNQGFQSLIAKEQNNNEYLYYLILTLKPMMLQKSSGSTFLEISPSKLKSIEVIIPEPKEQNRIAQILCDMDNEIEGLERKLEKYKMLKQGMMQNLLTGKIRLI